MQKISHLAMPKHPFPIQLLFHALAVGTVIASFFLFSLWRSYEEARADDVRTLAELSNIRQSLALYATNHGQYPPKSAQSHIVSQTLTCLSDEGFVPLSRESCSRRNYLVHIKGRYAGSALLAPFQYRPLSSDGSNPCTSRAGCPSYAVPFMLKTNAFFLKGSNVMTEQGVQQRVDGVRL